MYTFAQHRQLPVLAPHIPIGIMAPTLRRQAYEMVCSVCVCAHSGLRGHSRWQ